MKIALAILLLPVAAFGSQPPDAKHSDALTNVAAIPGPEKTTGVFEVMYVGPRLGFFRLISPKHGDVDATRHVYTADAGVGGDVEGAIIKKMIDVIREQYPKDFNWDSRRLKRVVVLSARPEDEARLAAFLRLEFFVPEVTP